MDQNLEELSRKCHGGSQGAQPSAGKLIADPVNRDQAGNVEISLHVGEGVCVV